MGKRNRVFPGRLKFGETTETGEEGRGRERKGDEGLKSSTAREEKRKHGRNRTIRGRERKGDEGLKSSTAKEEKRKHERNRKNNQLTFVCRVSCLTSCVSCSFPAKYSMWVS